MGIDIIAQLRPARIAGVRNARVNSNDCSDGISRSFLILDSVPVEDLSLAGKWTSRVNTMLHTLKTPVMTNTPKYKRSSPKTSFVARADSGPAKAAMQPPDTTSVTAREAQWLGTTSTAEKRQ
jgi:hypothetical protein